MLGANEFGELGIPPEDSPFPCSSRPCSLSPVAVSGGLRFQHVVAGGQFTCGITTGDEVFCWGRNDIGQLGTGSSAGASSTPAEIAGNRRYRQVRAGLGNAACAIATSRDAYCWGGGPLGNGSIRSRVPVRVGNQLEWAQLSVGGTHACGITTTNQAWCWGRNEQGQLGNGTTTRSGGPTRSAEGLAVAQIAAGGATTCAVLLDARAFCWGRGVGIGDGKGTGRRLSPTPVAGTRKWDNVSAGAGHSCGVTQAGRGFCWARAPSATSGTVPRRICSGRPLSLEASNSSPSARVSCSPAEWLREGRRGAGVITATASWAMGAGSTGRSLSRWWHLRGAEAIGNLNRRREIGTLDGGLAYSSSALDPLASRSRATDPHPHARPAVLCRETPCSKYISFLSLRLPLAARPTLRLPPTPLWRHGSIGRRIGGLPRPPQGRGVAWTSYLPPSDCES